MEKTPSKMSSALQDANDSVGKAQPFGHHCDDMAQQGLRGRRILNFHVLIGVEIERIEYARRLRDSWSDFVFRSDLQGGS
jgi:hypothetical protein